MGKKFIHETDITGYNILSNSDLDALHEATLQLMEDYGLQMHGKEALDILAGAGCEVDYENDRVKFPRNLVNEAIELCPAEFTFQQDTVFLPIFCRWVFAEQQHLLQLQVLWFVQTQKSLAVSFLHSW